MLQKKLDEEVAVRTKALKDAALAAEKRVKTIQQTADAAIAELNARIAELERQLGERTASLSSLEQQLKQALARELAAQAAEQQARVAQQKLQEEVDALRKLLAEAADAAGNHGVYLVSHFAVAFSSVDLVVLTVITR